MFFDSFSLTLGLSVLVIGFLARTVLGWKKYPQAPGPFLARFTNLWQGTQMAKGQFEAVNVELHQRHGMLCASNA